MRILCLIPAMGAGGAERVMSYLVAHWIQHHDVTLLTLEEPGTAAFYHLPESLPRIQVDRRGSRGMRRPFTILSRVRVLRRVVEDLAPDVIVSFTSMMNVTALVACLRTGIPVIVCDRNDPSHQRIGWTRNLARGLTYALARLVVVQTRRIGDYFPPSLRPTLRIVGNPVPVARCVARPDIPGADRRMRVIAVGRLIHQKGFDRLIDAFALVAGARPDWDLTIVGEGWQRPALENQVRQRSLEGRVSLPGVGTDIFRELAASHLLVIPSRYEGFPNALAEGLAAGLPAVGFSGVSGVEELIVHGETGLLVDPREGVAGLARALSLLMADAPRRTRFGDAARRHVSRWAPDRIFGQWDDLLAEAVGARAGRPT